ncbi:low molecular weight protein-tyrosine-phosphatase [Kribbella sp. VKM Ac-2566]|uniref:low molecular weight protein-tyrosine-phosphatase n=1 Tax=Kribbella sp. VKM Ac-2566 TaxID=2512218 RepID=UPI0010634D82|nr:low molecular weight protein-tyrosine-phosphatase [Kribbella sp. VKM Ac-2566]TDW81023.1 protein-tyrosine phosphatase [Kribbella sp. VKM Ac-2566]
MRVEIVCTGNICRSPMGEVVLRAKLADAGLDDVEVTSSGTGGWHVGDRMDPRAAAALRRRGYDGSAHRARQFERAGDPDLILAMDSSHLDTLTRYGAAAQLFARDDVPDPYYGEDNGFDDVLAQIEKAADQWVDRLRNKS